MKHALLIAALICGPLFAETLSVGGDYAGQPASGTATLELEDEPRLELTVGSESWALRGFPLLRGGYLFVEQTAGGLTGDLIGTSPQTPIRRAVVLATLLNVRPTPSTDHQPLRQVTQGATLPLSGRRDGDWVEVAAGGGWLHTDHVRSEEVYDADSIVSSGLRLTLRTSSSGYTAVIAGQSDVLRLVPRSASGAPRALLIPADVNKLAEEKALMGYARRLAGYYRQRGLEPEVVQAVSANQVIRHLEDAALAGKRYARVVWIGHGGWDGPIMGQERPRQVSGKFNDDGFQRLVTALDQALTLDAKIYASTCHAAGSNTYELQMFNKSLYNWVHDLARRTKRTVAGPAGLTSTEYTYRQVLAVLEGVGTAVQETHVADGKWLRVVWPQRTLQGVPAVPVPEISTGQTPPDPNAPPEGTLP